MADYKFKTFISYSRAADNMLAPELKSALQGFAKPWYRLKAISAFCDQTNLTANPDLWSSIEQNLEQSEYFIYLASPNAAQSKWVRKEIGFFHKMRNADNIIIVLTDGNLVWDDERSDFNWHLTDSFPQLDKRIFDKEPLWLDLRWIRKEQLSPRDPRFLDTTASLSSIMRKIDKDTLIGRDVEEHRKVKRFRLFSFLGLGILAVFLLIAAVLAVRSQKLSQQRLVKTYNINGSNLMESGDYTRALPWFIEALAIEENEDRKSSYMYRIETLLNQMPLLVQAWQVEAPVLKSDFINDSTVLILSGPVENMSPSYDCDEKGPEGCTAVLSVLDAKTGKDKMQPLRIRDGVRTFALSDDKSYFACLSIQNVLRLWDLRTGMLVWQKQTNIPASNDWFYCQMAFNPQGTLLSFLHEKNIAIYTAQNGDSLNLHTTRDYGPGEIAFAEDGETLLFVDLNGLKSWNVRTGNIKSIAVPYLDGVGKFRLSNDRKHIAFFGSIKQKNGIAVAAMNDIKTPLLTREIDADLGQPKIAFDRNTNVLGINVGYTTEGGSGDEGSRVWSLKDNRTLSGLIKFSQEADLSFDSSGSKVVITSDEGTTEVWTTANPDRSTNSRKLWILHDGVQSTKTIFSNNNEYLLTRGGEFVIKLWKLPFNDKLPFELQGTDNSIDSTMQWEALLGNGYDSIMPDSCAVYVRNIKTNKVAGNPLKHNSMVTNAVLSPDENYIATLAVEEGCIWDRKTGKKIANLSFSKEMPYANSIAFSSDSKKLLIGVNYTARVWDVATGKVITPYIKHPSILNYLDGYNSTAAFSKDGKLIITGEFGSYKIWDASNGEPMSALVEYATEDESESSKTNIVKQPFSIRDISLENLRLYTALLAGQTLDLNSGFVNLSGGSFMEAWVLWMNANVNSRFK